MSRTMPPPQPAVVLPPPATRLEYPCHGFIAGRPACPLCESRTDTAVEQAHRRAVLSAASDPKRRFR